MPAFGFSYVAGILPLSTERRILEGSQGRYSKAHIQRLRAIKTPRCTMAVQTKEQIVTLLHEHHHHIRAFGVRRLGLFGSFVREQQRSESDVDILVEFEPGAKTFDAFMQLAFFLEALFGRRVELVTPESLSPYIGPHILHEMTYVSFTEPLSPAHTHRDSVSPEPGAGAGKRDLSAR